MLVGGASLTLDFATSIGVDAFGRDAWDAILPGAAYEEFVEHLDLDYITGYDKLVGWKWDMHDEARLIVKDQWGGLALLPSDQPTPCSRP